MSFPSISIVTVTYNDMDGLKKTMDSIVELNYPNYQYIVVDGGSTDGSVELIKKATIIDNWISEEDKGIYHAMNKAITLATGDWLLFMNAGDIFFSADCLGEAVACIKHNTDVIYSDWLYSSESGKLAIADKKKMNVRHQSVIYRKKLHEIYGTYVVANGVTISDFIFFLSLSNLNWVYSKQPLSICDENGVSSEVFHFYQRIAIELVFAHRSRLSSIFILLFHPIYRFIKRSLLSM